MVIATRNKLPADADGHLGGGSDWRISLLPPIPSSWEANEQAPPSDAAVDESPTDPDVGPTYVRDPDRESEDVGTAIPAYSPIFPQDTPGEPLGLAVAYESWLESEERTKRARDDLKLILEARVKAAQHREMAREVFDSG